METPKVRRRLVSSGKEDVLKWRMIQLKKIQIEVLKRELELWTEWKSLTRKDKGTRRFKNSQTTQTTGEVSHR